MQSWEHSAGGRQLDRMAGTLRTGHRLGGSLCLSTRPRLSPHTASTQPGLATAAMGESGVKALSQLPRGQAAPWGPGVCWPGWGSLHCGRQGLGHACSSGGCRFRPAPWAGAGRAQAMSLCLCREARHVPTRQPRDPHAGCLHKPVQVGLQLLREPEVLQEWLRQSVLRDTPPLRSVRCPPAPGGPAASVAHPVDSSLLPLQVQPPPTSPATGELLPDTSPACPGPGPAPSPWLGAFSLILLPGVPCILSNKAASPCHPPGCPSVLLCS